MFEMQSIVFAAGTRIQKLLGDPRALSGYGIGQL